MTKTSQHLTALRSETNNKGRRCMMQVDMSYLTNQTFEYISLYCFCSVNSSMVSITFTFYSFCFYRELLPFLSSPELNYLHNEYKKHCFCLFRIIFRFSRSSSSLYIQKDSIFAFYFEIKLSGSRVFFMGIWRERTTPSSEESRTMEVTGAGHRLFVRFHRPKL